MIAELVVPDWILPIIVVFFIGQSVAGLAWGINMTFKVKELGSRDDVQQKRIDHLEKVIENTNSTVGNIQQASIRTEGKLDNQNDSMKRLENMMNILHDLMREGK